ncbi:hypothetical protein ZWY2020_030026 [Hordeum vulgare]|nr:hypothetical protein ZWY2020_030026 [Hordeum vulgare]
MKGARQRSHSIAAPGVPWSGPSTLIRSAPSFRILLHPSPLPLLPPINPEPLCQPNPNPPNQERCGGEAVVWRQFVAFCAARCSSGGDQLSAVTKEKRNGPPQQQPHQQQQYHGRGGTGRAYAFPDFHCGDEGRCDHPSKHHRVIDVEVGVGGVVALEVGVGGGTSAASETRERRTTTEDFAGGYIRCKLPLKQNKLTGMVHEMCSVISHAVGKLVTGFGRNDDDEWGARTIDPDNVETSRRQSKRRRQQVPTGTDSLPSDKESFISDDDGSEEDHSENDEVCEDKDNDGNEEDGSSDNDDGDEVETSVHMGREVEIDGNRDKEDEEEGKEDDDDDEVREMLDIEDRSLALEAKRIFEELLSAKDLDLPFTFNPEEICPKEIRQKFMREIGSTLEVGEPKQVGHNQVPPPPLPKKKKSVSFILEPIVMNETGGDPQTFHSENSKYGQGLASKQTSKHASCTQVMATQSKQEASPTAFQPSLAEATLNATRVVPIQLKKGGNTLSVSKAKPGGTQPLGDLTCQVPFSSRGNVKQVGNAFQRGKVQDLKASPQAVLLNDAGQEKEKENIPPAVSCMEIKREQDKIAETTANISEQKLLTTLGKLPVCSTADAKPEDKSVSEVVQASSHENLFHLSDVEDRFQKFMSLSGKTTNALEVNVLDVSELLASAMVIAYGGYFVTVRELAKSMKKEGFVLSHVMEVGIQSIMFNLPPDSKKAVMPLRFLIWLQKMELTSKELISRFKKSNHLDRQDMIMFLVLENNDKKEPVTGNHYWIFNVNIRDRRFEVLDSWRTLKNKSLDVCTRKIVASVCVLWEEHYARSHICLDDFGLINIDVPQQDNE